MLSELTDLDRLDILLGGVSDSEMQVGRMQERDQLPSEDLRELIAMYGTLGRRLHALRAAAGARASREQSP